VSEATRDDQQPNFYELLQVSPRAQPEVILAAYRVLARSYHPDISTDPNAARLMRALNVAYDVLSDPERRAQYDAQWNRSTRARVRARQPSSNQPSNNQPSSRAHRRAGPRAPAAALLVEYDAVSPAVRLLLALVMLMLVVAFGLGLWLIYDAAQDRPFGSLRPVVPGLGAVVPRAYWPPVLFSAPPASPRDGAVGHRPRA